MFVSSLPSKLWSALELLNFSSHMITYTLNILTSFLIEYKRPKYKAICEDLNNYTLVFCGNIILKDIFHSIVYSANECGSYKTPLIPKIDWLPLKKKRKT